MNARALQKVSCGFGALYRAAIDAPPDLKAVALNLAMLHPGLTQRLRISFWVAPKASA
jgi:hypothetical protein